MHLDNPLTPIVGAFFALLAVPAQACEQADWLFTGEHIVTMESEAQPPTALAVCGERIAWLGALEDAQAHVGPETQRVELGARALLPGFIDAHGHIGFFAITNQMANIASPPVGPAIDIASLQQTLRDHVQARRELKLLTADGWIVGFGYDDSLLAESRHPTREDLDEVSTDQPIALMHVSGHLATANSKALALAGINADSIDRHALRRRRDDHGEP